MSVMSVARNLSISLPSPHTPWHTAVVSGIMSVMSVAKDFLPFLVSIDTVGWGISSVMIVANVSRQRVTLPGVWRSTFEVVCCVDRWGHTSTGGCGGCGVGVYFSFFFFPSHCLLTLAWPSSLCSSGQLVSHAFSGNPSPKEVLSLPGPATIICTVRVTSTHSVTWSKFSVGQYWEKVVLLCALIVSLASVCWVTQACNGSCVRCIVYTRHI